jgi:alpha-amylase
MQDVAARELYGLRAAVRAQGDPDLLRDWQRLTTSDHLYYMCTKWFADGDVHKYFSPFESPYEGYINFTHVLNDLAARAGARRTPRIELSERPSERWARGSAGAPSRERARLPAARRPVTHSP